MGNRKRSLAVLATVIVILLAALVAADRRAESSDGRVGRFEIAVGCHVASIGKGSIEKDDIRVQSCAMIKIDTVTGQTWVYRERINTQSVVTNEYDAWWEPIE